MLNRSEIQHTLAVAITLNKKLMFLVMMVGLFAFFVTGYVSYDHATAVITDTTYNQLEGESKSHGATLTVLLESRLAKNSILASDVDMHELVQDASQSSGLVLAMQGYHARFLEHINNFEQRTGYSMEISDLSILDANSNHVFVLHDEHDLVEQDLEYFHMGVHKNAFVVFENGEHGPTIAVVNSMRDVTKNDKLVGVLVTRTSASLVNDILLANSGLGESGEVYLVDHNKQMISPSKFDEGAIFNTIIDNEAVSTCLDDQQSYAGIYKNYMDKTVYGTSYCSFDLGLVLIAEQDQHIVEMPLQQLQNNILQMGLFIMAGMTGMAILVARTISRPICRLKTVAGEIAGGNFDIQSEIDTKRSDEIGDLAGEFDTMAQKLKESMSRLREKEGIIRQQEGVLLQFSSHSEKYCVGMVDIMNSTKTCAKMNDTQMSEFYKTFINQMGLVIQKYEGVVVKNIGDALLFYFSIYGHDEKQILKKCIDCCINMCEIHPRLERRLHKLDLPKINYRISVTYGIVRIANSSTSNVEDIFGTTVNRCSKINRSALANGVVIDEYFYEVAKDLKEYEFEKVEKDAVLTDHGYTCYTAKKKMLAEVSPAAKAAEKTMVQ